MQAKYIINEHGHVMIFSPEISHKQASKAIKGTIASAGFCEVFGRNFEDITVSVFGDSESLHIVSKPEDEAKLKRLLALAL